MQKMGLISLGLISLLFLLITQLASTMRGLQSVSRRWLLLSKLKQGLSKRRKKDLFPWEFSLEKKEKVGSSKAERVLKSRESWDTWI
ncbi:hypothetical protein MANES_15G130250v8 [Manihot esculenta]|uniref:Uncharacterized protein n=1 Tax=Manihot esculenta TaxID=3983 RepID=A0ACB7GBQ5_MANES|nr:hypothetical protein MANES_15G130250v8 [Manihot esculenta]